jgi:NAD(P)-dependent dehydrogenase (short-subunit alcohol dehydrogenase family)
MSRSPLSSTNFVPAGGPRTGCGCAAGGNGCGFGSRLPVGALGDPADFGAIVTFLCSEQSKFVTGLQLHVDGGTYGGLQ